MSREQITTISLQPAWLGKVNWARGLPLSPENYKAAQVKILDYWSEFISPVWDYLREYRKSYSNNYHNSFNNYEAQRKEQDIENQFTTFSKNKKTNKQSSSIFNKSFIPNNKINDETEISEKELEIEYANSNFHIDDDSVYEVNIKDNYKVEIF